jgi:hypothetical protein
VSRRRTRYTYTERSRYQSPEGWQERSKTHIFPFLKGLAALSYIERGVYLYPVRLTAHNILNVGAGFLKFGKPNHVQYTILFETVLLMCFQIISMFIRQYAELIHPFNT